MMTMAPQENDSLKRAVKIIFIWMPLALVFCAIVTCLSAIFFLHLSVIVGPIMAMFIGYSIYHLLKALARRRGMTVVSYVETAVRLNLPVDAYLEAAERSESPGVRDRLHMVRAMMAQGVPIGTALMSVSEIPPTVVASVAASERVGQLQPALSRAMADETRRQQQVSSEVPFYRFYPIFVGGMVFTLVTGFMIFVVPKFREIFKDFKVSLPWSTELLVHAADVLVDQTPIAAIILVMMFLLFMFVLASLLERTFRGGESSRQSSLIDQLLWYVPIVGRLSRSGSLAQVCRFLADATRAGVPLPAALQEAGGLHVNGEARQRVHRWQQELLAGKGAAEGAAVAGMPPLMVGLLDTAQAPRAGGADNTANVFDFLARYYGARFSRLGLLLKGAYEPVMLLALGTLVGFVVYALFSPLVKLILSVIGGYPQGTL
jgi:type II secretory pathway component PulF